MFTLSNIFEECYVTKRGSMSMSAFVACCTICKCSSLGDLLTYLSA